jgi:hypothetical protein
MRISLVVAAVALPFVLMPASAQAQNYPWCGQYAPGGSINCGFVTIQQCMAAISGNGGSCEANPMYQPGPDGPPPPRRPRR